MHRILGKVVVLLWVGLLIVELSSILALIPLGVAIAIGADGASFTRLAALHLGKSRDFPRRVRIAQQWNEALSLQHIGSAQARQLSNRGVQINKFAQSATTLAGVW